MNSISCKNQLIIIHVFQLGIQNVVPRGLVSNRNENELEIWISALFQAKQLTYEYRLKALSR